METPNKAGDIGGSLRDYDGHAFQKFSGEPKRVMPKRACLAKIRLFFGLLACSLGFYRAVHSVHLRGFKVKVGFFAGKGTFRED
jgi:hypothetical protein